MKILIASDTYYPHVNGASYFTQRLAHSLQQRGHTVLVIAPSRTRQPESFTHENVAIYGVPTLPFVIHQNFRFASPFKLKRINEVVTDFKPDIVHIQGHFPISRKVGHVAKQLHIPLMATNHFMPENLLVYLPVPIFFKNVLKKWAWADFRRIFKDINIVTTPTITAATLLQRVGLPQKIEALSCGIDTAIFHPNHKNKDLKKKYHIPDKPVLLYVGRLDKEKNIDSLLKAVALITPPVRPHFVIAGQGAEKDSLVKLVSELDLEADVTFTGFIPNQELPVIYTMADCFIIAGIAELQSIATMEAMASGLPVIAVNAVALPELVHHGKNGYLFNLDNLNQLKDYIQTITSKPELRQSMSQHSLSIIQKHDSKRVITLYEKLYARAIARPSVA